MKNFTATYNGHTANRKSNRNYTHGSVIQWKDGTYGITFHMSEVAALKGVLTAQQKQNGAFIVATVPVTHI